MKGVYVIEFSEEGDLRVVEEARPVAWSRRTAAEISTTFRL